MFFIFFTILVSQSITEFFQDLSITVLFKCLTEDRQTDGQTDRNATAKEAEPQHGLKLSFNPMLSHSLRQTDS